MRILLLGSGRRRAPGHRPAFGRHPVAGLSRPPRGTGASEEPPGPSLADPSLAPHCDRFAGTSAHFVGSPAVPRRHPTDRSEVRCYSARDNHRCAPSQAPRDRYLGRAAPGLPRHRAPVCRYRLPEVHPSLNKSWRTGLTYTDRTLTCVDCGVEFIHSAADQEFYEQKGFVSDPKRCTSCRASRRAARDGGRPRTCATSEDRAATSAAIDRPARVLRGPLLVVRQPGPGPVQAADGPPGLLLGLLPVALGRLTRPHAADVRARARRKRDGRSVRIAHR